MVPFCRRDRWIHALALLTAIGLFAVLAVVWVHPHYAAPFVAPLAILYLAAARRLSEVRIGLHRVGWILVLAIGVRWTMIGVQKYGIALSLSDIKHRPAWVAARMRLQDELTQDPTAKHVVIVRYGAEHDVHEEWVYNSADLPTQPVIFARDLGPELNARLAMHFSDRTVWIVHVTNDPRQVRLEPLEASSRPSVNQDGSPASRASRVSTEIK
jgi:hypothetical protein